MDDFDQKQEPQQQDSGSNIADKARDLKNTANNAKRAANAGKNIKNAVQAGRAGAQAASSMSGMGGAGAAGGATTGAAGATGAAGGAAGSAAAAGGAAAGASGAAGAAGGVAAGAAGSAAAAGGTTAAVATSEVWGTVALIIIVAAIIVLLIALVVSTILDKEGQIPTCDGISASNSYANAGSPVMLTLDNCSGTASITWSSVGVNGVFAPQGPSTIESTTYTPIDVTADTTTTIQASVCSTSDQTKCNYYTVTVMVNSGDCASNGGSCTTSACANPTSGLCSTGVCCSTSITPPSSGFHFFCQYDRDYQTSSCDIAGNGCTATSVAMCLYSLGHTSWNPLKVAVQSGGHGCNSGSNPFDFKTLMINAGVSPKLSVPLANYSTSYNYDLAKKYLAAGCYLLTGADQTWGSRSGVKYGGGHASVITAIGTVNGVADVITQQDPTFCTSDTNGRPRYITRARKNVYSPYDLIVRQWWWSYAICP